MAGIFPACINYFPRSYSSLMGGFNFQSPIAPNCLIDSSLSGLTAASVPGRYIHYFVFLDIMTYFQFHDFAFQFFVWRSAVDCIVIEEGTPRFQTQHRCLLDEGAVLF